MQKKVEATMSLLCDLQMNLNEEFTFFINQDLISKYSGFLKKKLKQSNKKNKKGIITLNIKDFPGDSYGFEMVSRFCYSNGKGISVHVENVAVLYCSSLFLEMSEKLCSSNLLHQTEKFLQGMFQWSWNDAVSCLESCEKVFLHADSYGLVDKLVFLVLAKIAESSYTSHVFASSSSYSASSMPLETANNSLDSDKKSTFRSTSRFRSVSCKTSNEWWFDDMSILGPKIIEKVIKSLGAYDNLVLTRFLLHYLKTKLHNNNNNKSPKKKLDYAGLADTAVQGVIISAKTAFSCRKILWVLRVLSGLGISKESRIGLERVIGEILDEATLDDLLIPIRGDKRDKGFYDVDLVIRLVKVFVKSCKREEEEDQEEDKSLRMRSVGTLIDKYLREISPDKNLKVFKFLEVAESLQDSSARDCFDGLYKAIDIYLESHPNISTEDRTKLCRCINYKKLTLETCKQLAKNPKIPPNIAVQALKSQQLSNETKPCSREDKVKLNKIKIPRKYVQEKPILVRLKGSNKLVDGFEENLRMNLGKKHSENVCREKKSEVVSRLVRHGHTNLSSSNFPRLC